jgi:hypothetical protein
MLLASIEVAYTFQFLLRSLRAIAAPREVGLEHPVMSATFCLDMMLLVQRLMLEMKGQVSEVWMLSLN